MSDELVYIFQQMVTLFAIVGIGYLAKKLHLMTDSFDKQLSKVIVNLSMPAMILGAVLGAEELPAFAEIIEAFKLSIVAYAVIILIAYIATFVMRISVGHRGVFKFMICFANVGFIGFPVLQAIFGNQALIYAAVFNLPFNFLVFTIGIIFLLEDNASADKKLAVSWRTFATPAIISCVIAIICVLVGVCNVPVVGQCLETLGSMTTPAALLIIGSSLANMPARELVGGPRLWIASAVRLVLCPVCVFLVAQFFVSNTFLLAVIVVIAGMPVATNGTMLCYEYGGDSKTMAQGTFVTTVFSIVTIPVLASVVSTVI
jgi:predicted permease